MWLYYQNNLIVRLLDLYTTQRKTYSHVMDFSEKKKEKKKIQVVRS